MLPAMEYPPVLAPAAAAVNINDAIMRRYLHDVLPGARAQLARPAHAELLEAAAAAALVAVNGGPRRPKQAVRHGRRRDISAAQIRAERALER